MNLKKSIYSSINKFLILVIFLTVNAFANDSKCIIKTQTKQPKQIAWFAGSKGTGFWPMVEKLMKAASKDIGVTLEVYYTTDPLEYINNAKKVLDRKENPIDGIIFHNHKHKGEELLKLAQSKAIPAMMFNAGFASLDNVGAPREKYSCWIGSMFPDDEKAGYHLAQALLLEAKKHPNMIYENKIHMVALEGDRASNVSTLRIKGMEKALIDWERDKSNPKVVLHQSFHSKWRRNLASIAFKLTQSRYPKASVFWTAADSMALGVVDAANELGKRQGVDFLTGGMDLLPYTFENLENGNLTASVGAHYIEGAFAIIALYDYLNGYDFAQVGTTTFNTKMAVKVGKPEQALPKDDITIQKRLDSIDFSLLSNTHNGQNLPYKLDTQAILNKLW